MGGATSGGAGAPPPGPGELGRVAVGGALGALDSGLGAASAPDTTPPPHLYPTRLQARVPRAREEQLELEREELELQRLEEQQQQLQQQQQQEPPQQQEEQQQLQQEQQQAPQE
ncbi:unnamed protein product [Closterium sp. NIES-64]|nr:unnamed protein product [Closterium sp. NIES-64]